MDSDSSDDLPINGCPFQNGSTIASVKGPNVAMTNITGLSFRNNVFSSTMQMPIPFERPRYAESSYDQQSLSNRREVSPFSVRSAYDMGHRNPSNYSFNFQGLGARSVFNGRSGSPMSIRTIDTSATVSAGDIVQAIHNKQYNERELKFIKDACCNKLFRSQTRKKNYRRPYHRIKKRKNGYDSGEMGSNSSLSDDNWSVVTSNHRNNISSSRSAITNISNFKRKMTTSDMFHNRTGNFRFNPYERAHGGQTSQTSFRSSQSVHGGEKMSLVKNMPLRANFNMHEKNASVMLQKDRFNSGYKLPSQRFNKSTIPTSIPENVENGLEKETHTQNGYLATNKNNRNNIETDSDDDSIFSNTTTQKQPINVNRKRSMEGEDTFQPNQKRFKPLSPCKNSIEDLKNKKLKACKGNDFIFAKPACPVRKPVKEKLISKSAAPLSDNISVITVMPPEIEQPNQEKPVDEEAENTEYESNSTNLSMRPSFIKRKLFTQNLDITEKRNLSVDNLNSPQNSVYGAIQKERHKARKLQQATTQSCLSRDVEKDGNNLLDLIQKIVPIDQMNVTNQTNKTASQSKNITGEDDKWDISTNSQRNNDDNVSDTYTDEEILNSTVKELQNSSKKNKDKVKKDAPTKVSPAKTKSCKIIEKLPPTFINSQAITKHFWDTDFESDLEIPSPKIDKSNIKENRRPDIVPPKEPPKAQRLSSNLSSKRPVAASGSSQNYTFNTTNFFSSTLRIRSHNTFNLNKLDRKITDTKSTLLNNTERKREKDQVINCIKVSHDRPNEEEPAKIENKKSVEKASKGKKQENIATERDNKSPKSKKREKSATRKENKNSAKSNKQEAATRKENKNSAKSNKQEAATRKDNKNSPKGKKQDPVTKISPTGKKQDTSANNDHKTSPKAIVQQKTATKKDKNYPKENKVSKTDKQNQHTNKQKPIESKYENPKTQDKSKETGRKLRNTPQKPNTSDKENIVENSSAQTKKLSTNKKLLEKVASNKVRKTNDSSIIEENNNNITRTRSRSRTNANNQTMKANTANVKETMNLTLRSSKLNSSNKNNAKPEQKGNKSDTRLSDVSFSLVAEKNILAKRAVKRTNSRLLDDDSDLSFSLTPTPRKTRPTTRNSTSLLNKTFSQNKTLNNSEIRQNRRKLPNKRYIF